MDSGIKKKLTMALAGVVALSGIAMTQVHADEGSTVPQPDAAAGKKCEPPKSLSLAEKEDRTKRMSSVVMLAFKQAEAAGKWCNPKGSEWAESRAFSHNFRGMVSSGDVYDGDWSMADFYESMDKQGILIVETPRHLKDEGVRAIYYPQKVGNYKGVLTVPLTLFAQGDLRGVIENHIRTDDLSANIIVFKSPTRVDILSPGDLKGFSGVQLNPCAKP